MSLPSTFSLSRVLLLVYISSSYGNRAFRDPSCGYESCTTLRPGFINVHLVPHTHDDVGWLKSPDQYYYGARSDIQFAGVQYILDSVVQALTDNPARRFIYVEMAFFAQWWKEQGEEVRSTVRDLVSSGRLEFINGGWCMNDEATTHYADMVDQMSLGFTFLNETFGECGRPRVGWQVDTFGHSREQAFIFAQMGFDGMFFGRLDYEDKNYRIDTRTMEMVWSASNSFKGDGGSLFSGVNYNRYQAPSGFCFDVLCSNQPLIDNPKSKEYNVDGRVTEFLDYCKRQADVYNTSNILLTMGGDFNYQDAHMYFNELDKLVRYSNEKQQTGSNINVIYSTPSCYVKALNELNRSWPTKTDDFFPYGSNAQAYWTGYYTSRPTLKYMTRQGSNLLQGCKQMASALAADNASNEGDVAVLQEAIAVMQHHDAITGTEKQAVANHYAKLVHKGVVECQKTQTSFYRKELPTGAVELPVVSHCQLNVSQCDVSETRSSFVVNVYNSLARPVDKYVRIPVTAGSYTVLDPDGSILDAQIVPLAAFIQALPERTGAATEEVVFLASQLPPLGSKSYYVQKGTANGIRRTFQSMEASRPRADSIISSDRIAVVVDGSTGLMKSVTVDGKETPVRQEFVWYAGFAGDNAVSENRSSGAYVFRPNGTEDYPIYESAPPAFVSKIYTGPLVQEIHQYYDSWVGQVIRIYRGQGHVELDWVVGPIPAADGVGKEIVNRVTTPLSSAGTFFTDSNGRQTMKRKLNSREDYPNTVTEPVASNYYPVSSHIYIEDSESGEQVALLVDRSQGGTSLRDGELELMVHRRLLHDDSFGVNEALNELAYSQGLVTRGTHYLVVGSSPRSIRRLSQELYRQPLVSFMATELGFNEWTTHFKTKNQFLVRALPENVHLMTMEPRSDGTYLLRLEHIYDVGEDSELSLPVTVSLDNLFAGWTVTARETTLGGNQFIEDSNRLVWNTKRSEGGGKAKRAALPDVELRPMEIRTFVVTLNKRDGDGTFEWSNK